jgi:hypothetical protein
MNNSQNTPKEKIKLSNVNFWIHRLLEEKVEQSKKVADEISVLNHQSQFFNQMEEVHKKMVINELNEHFIKLGWNYKIEKED